MEQYGVILGKQWKDTMLSHFLSNYILNLNKYKEIELNNFICNSCFGILVDPYRCIICNLNFCYQCMIENFSGSRKALCSCSNKLKENFSVNIDLLKKLNKSLYRIKIPNLIGDPNLACFYNDLINFRNENLDLFRNSNHFYFEKYYRKLELNIGNNYQNLQFYEESAHVKFKHKVQFSYILKSLRFVKNGVMIYENQKLHAIHALLWIQSGVRKIFLKNCIITNEFLHLFCICISISRLKLAIIDLEINFLNALTLRINFICIIKALMKCKNLKSLSLIIPNWQETCGLEYFISSILNVYGLRKLGFYIDEKQIIENEKYVMNCSQKLFVPNLQILHLTYKTHLKLQKWENIAQFFDWFTYNINLKLEINFLILFDNNNFDLDSIPFLDYLQTLNERGKILSKFNLKLLKNFSGKKLNLTEVQNNIYNHFNYFITLNSNLEHLEIVCPKIPDLNQNFFLYLVESNSIKEFKYIFRFKKLLNYGNLLFKTIVRDQSIKQLVIKKSSSKNSKIYFKKKDEEISIIKFVNCFTNIPKEFEISLKSIKNLESLILEGLIITKEIEIVLKSKHLIDLQIQSAIKKHKKT